MMGLILGALGGAGEVMASLYSKKSILEEQATIDRDKAEALKQAQIELEGVRAGHEKERTVLADELRRAPAEKVAKQIADANKEVWVEDGVGGGMKQAPTKAEQTENRLRAMESSGSEGLIGSAAQARATAEGHDIQREGQAKQERISEKTLASHEKISEEMRKSQERIAGMHASIQKQIAEMGQNGVQVLKDGTMVQTKQGKVIDYLRDPITGERLTSKKNNSEGDLALMRSLVAENKGQEAIAKAADSSPEQRANAAAQIKENTKQLWLLAGREQPKQEFPKPSAAEVEQAKKRAADPRNGAAAMAAYAARFGDEAAAAVMQPRAKEAADVSGIISSSVSDQETYGPLTPMSIIERDAKAGKQKAIEYLKRKQAAELENEIARQTPGSQYPQ